MIQLGKIDLQEPYKTNWKYGYIVQNLEPRRNVILYNSEKNRSSVSYARYLYEVNIGKYLPKDITVDHIDNNKLNDTIENLQLLSQKENNIKAIKVNNATRKMVQLICGTCGTIFEKPHNQTHLCIKSRKSTWCSKHCRNIKNKSLSTVLNVYRA